MEGRRWGATRTGGVGRETVEGANKVAGGRMRVG